ncbi:hypothetical protein LTR66_005728 [Elasticomyces elasticus]|nr:hypothetical protein LTR66_005728 [Elasticomyces elasticus]
MSSRKRCLLWDWTNTDGPGHQGVPWAMDTVKFDGPISSVSNWNTWTPPELKGRVPFRPMNHGKRLVSPSCASDQTGQDWIHAWMELVSTNPPDYLGLHYYGTDGYAMIAYLNSMNQRYPNTPIIVSQFASTSRNYMDVLGFTVQVVNWMDSVDWIFEYALFGCMRTVADDFVSPVAQLMKPDGSFTDLMWKYMSDQPMHF